MFETKLYVWLNCFTAHLSLQHMTNYTYLIEPMSDRLKNTVLSWKWQKDNNEFNPPFLRESDITANWLHTRKYTTS